MNRLCSTRLLKNARFMQAPEIAFFPPVEPLEGFPSLVSAEVLGKLERIPIEGIRIEELAKVLSKRRPPQAGPKLAGALFSGTLRFVKATFASGGGSFEVPDADLMTTMAYTRLAAGPISAYCSQYGPNKVAVDNAAIPFNATVNGAM